MASAFKNTTINDTGQLTLPVGTSAQRPKYKIQSFTSNTTWVCPTDVSEIDVLVIAGGGAGGSSYGGGGGAGGLVYRSGFSVTPGSSYTVTVGAGGASTTGNAGANGQNSVFGSLTATGGGGGGFHGASGDLRCNGYAGGSGGGGSIGGSGGTPSTGTGGTGTEGQGYEGGTGYHVGSQYPTGGGGGAGGRGADGSTSIPKCGVGGPGLPFGISGTPTWYAGGGGGASGGTAAIGQGGIGGGGDGGAVAGTTNTGGGGGGVGNGGSASGAGGSGIVIIRYLAKREFTSNTTWTVPTGVNEVEVLVVAGGGGGGYGGGGGGGGGGVIYRPNFAVTPGQVLTVTVGSGGAAASGSTVPGTNGSNSVFGTLTAVGGGGGGTHTASGSGQIGSSGGSGGGGSMNYNTYTFAGGSGTTGQGNDGGSSLETTDNPRITSGGGGAGGKGTSSRSAVLFANMPNGGPGAPSSISGVLKYYGGGGGGGDTTYDRTGPGPGVGGIGGGGNGSRYSPSVASTAGATNTGGGGGGGSNGGQQSGGAGGSGIVIIRYNSDTASGVFENTFTPNKVRFNSSLSKIDIPKVKETRSGSDIDWPVQDGLTLLLDAGSQKSYPKLNIVRVKYWSVTTAARAANYTVQYSNDGTNWTTAFGGVADRQAPNNLTGEFYASVSSGGSGTTGTGAWGRRRYWRYVEGSTVSGHHPRVARIILVDNEGIEHELIHYAHDNESDVGGYIIGTVSTSVLGKTWYDISGNNRHFHLSRWVATSYSEANNVTTTSEFYEAGPQSYFLINSNPILSHAITSQRSIPFLGVPSDQMDFTQEHTIQSVVMTPGATINFLYHFAVNPRDIDTEMPAYGQNGTGSIRFASHLNYGGNGFYYDYPGCCDPQNRVDFGNGVGGGTVGGGVTGSVTMDASWTGNVKLATYRCRRNDFPRKQFYRNQTVEYSSLQRDVGYAINNRSDPGHLATGFNGARLYYFAFYNRALTDAELSTNWTYLSNRFNIS